MFAKADLLQNTKVLAIW